jgi:hypothetical protein
MSYAAFLLPIANIFQVVLLGRHAMARHEGSSYLSTTCIQLHPVRVAEEDYLGRFVRRFRQLIAGYFTSEHTVFDV